MTGESLHSQRSFTTPSSRTYGYIHLPPRADAQPVKYVLLLHGFPSTPHHFNAQIEHLSSLDYGVIAPSLLGYSPTSAPTTPDAYRLKLISDDLISLVDDILHAQPHSVTLHAVGHDWGVTILSRLAVYLSASPKSHKFTLGRLVFLSIAPTPLAAPFDLDLANGMTEKMTGSEGFGYINFFTDEATRDEAVRVLNTRAGARRFGTLMLCKNEAENWRDWFRSVGGCQRYLRGEGSVEKAEWVTNADLNGIEDIADHGEGFRGPLMYYRALRDNINLRDETEWTNWTFDGDVLLVLGSKEGGDEMQVQMAQGYTSDSASRLKVETVDAGHWPMIEKRNEVNRLMESFFR